MHSYKRDRWVKLRNPYRLPGSPDPHLPWRAKHRVMPLSCWPTDAIIAQPQPFERAWSPALKAAISRSFARDVFVS
jgi:hypothetical protein